MTVCLECQRLKKHIKELEWIILSRAQRWIELKRFVIEQEEKSKVTNADQIPQKS